jgi:hypothetical protein
MHLWVQPAGGEWKSANVEQKMVTLIYPYPKAFVNAIIFYLNLKFVHQQFLISLSLFIKTI